MTEATFRPIEYIPSDIVIQLFEIVEGKGGDYMLSLHDDGPDACYTYACPASEGLFGWLPEELVGRPAYSVIHPDDRHPVEGSHQYVLQKKGARTETFYRILKKDGTYVPVKSWSWATDAGTIAVTGLVG